MQEIIKEYLDKNKISITKLSNETNIPYMSLYYSLDDKHRKRQLRLDEFLRICDYLDLSVDELRKQNTSKGSISTGKC